VPLTDGPRKVEEHRHENLPKKRQGGGGGVLASNGRPERLVPAKAIWGKVALSEKKNEGDKGGGVKKKNSLIRPVPLVPGIVM